MKLNEVKLADNADKGVDMQVTHPATGEPFDVFTDEATGRVLGSDISKPLGAYITLLGQDSAEYQKRVRAWIDKIRNKDKIPFADTEMYLMENRIACVVGWRGLELNGVDLECSPENVRLILTDPNYRWLCEQIDTFVADRANFISRSGRS